MLNNYTKLNNGLIKQEKIFDAKQKYDVEYIDKRYNAYGKLSEYMSYLRLGYLLGSCDSTITSILDVGYGNGDFLDAAAKVIPNCYGFEVNDYPIPKGCTEVSAIYNFQYDVVCFFDVLEHFDDIYEIKKLNTKYIYISVPECHYLSDDWFYVWKHRRPDEHLWHFNRQSLVNFMTELNYKVVALSNMEDTIRKGDGQTSNILTGLFKAV
jgi:hypothetical protein